ncbi:MAG: hypothetical protein MUE36_10485 [Acidimicrobiales bacterium]|nr:hypothetical protein [Acidimicrobiales bacterium]
MIRRILTAEEYLIDLDGPVRIGDTIEWYTDELEGFTPFEGVIPGDELDSMLLLAGVEIDDEDQEWIVKGTVTAISEVRVAYRLMPGQRNVWEFVAGSGQLVERTEFLPHHGEPFNPDHDFCGYLVTVDDA